MRLLLSTTAIGLVLALATPSVAQMCGGGSGGAAMCGMSTQAQAQSAPPAPNASPDQTAPQQAGGCACCRNMAMMRGGHGGMHMPGMEKPPAQ
jgi:hypothetical protein